MTHNILKKYLADYLSRSKVKIDITGFDMDAFSEAINQELKDKLDTVEYIAFEDEDIMPNDEKIKMIQKLFRDGFLE